MFGVSLFNNLSSCISSEAWNRLMDFATSTPRGTSKSEFDLVSSTRSYSWTPSSEKSHDLLQKLSASNQAQEIHAFIRSVLTEKYTKAAAESISILYGGSMKPENAKELLSCADIDGGLIGGAALESRSFVFNPYDFNKIQQHFVRVHWILIISKRITWKPYDCNGIQDFHMILLIYLKS